MNWFHTDPGVRVGSSSTDFKIWVPFQGFPGSNSGTRSVCQSPVEAPFIGSSEPDPPVLLPPLPPSVGHPSPDREPTDVDHVL